MHKDKQKKNQTLSNGCLRGSLGKLLGPSCERSKGCTNSRLLLIAKSDSSRIALWESCLELIQAIICDQFYIKPKDMHILCVKKKYGWFVWSKYPTRSCEWGGFLYQNIYQLNLLVAQTNQTFSKVGATSKILNKVE